MTLPGPTELPVPQWPAIAAFAAAIAVSLALTPIVVRGAAARGLFEAAREGERGPLRKVSRLGGIAVFTATVLGVLVGQSMGAFGNGLQASRVMPGLVLGGFVTFLLGLYDDLRGASPKLKLIVQLVAAIIVYALGTRIGVITIGASLGVDVGVLSLPLTLLWIVGVTNAFNLIDGMDGLATGIALVVLSAVMLAAMLLGNSLVVVVAAVLVGALLGFLRYNVSPARIFLGDSGSLFIGFALAVLSIHGSIKSTTAVLVAIPVFALAVPLLDTAVAILRRWLRGSPVFGADARHIHHRLLATGLSPHKAAVAMWALSGLFAVYGLSVAFAPPPVLLGLAVAGGVLASALAYVGVQRLAYVEFAEAVLAIVRRGGGVRKEIRDQIHAREMAELIPQIHSLEELNSLLSERRYRFGFVQIEVNRLSDLKGPPASNDLPRLIKVDYPLGEPGEHHEHSIWLRTWSPLDISSPMQSPVRVARILGPVLAEWIDTAGVRFGDRPRAERRLTDVQIPVEGIGRRPEAPWSAA